MDENSDADETICGHTDNEEKTGHADQLGIFSYRIIITFFTVISYL